MTVHACRYDKDGSGELETMEFVEAVRQTGASEEVCTNKELYKLFREVDTNRGGTIDATEFAAWLSRMEERCWEREEAGIQVAGWERVVQGFVDACDEQVQRMGWERFFKKFDADGDGELNQAEFMKAVRSECPTLKMDDDEIEEMFGIIDGDGGGTISGQEFYQGLAEGGAEETEMTFEVFSMSLFELADYWAPEKTEPSYIEFLRAAFRAVTIRKPSTIPEGARTIRGHPKEDINVIDETERGPNYQLRDLDDIQSIIHGGKFSDPFGAERRTKWVHKKSAEEERMLGLAGVRPPPLLALCCTAHAFFSLSLCLLTAQKASIHTFINGSHSRPLASIHAKSLARHIHALIMMRFTCMYMYV